MKRSLLLLFIIASFTQVKAQECCFNLEADTFIRTYNPTWGSWMQDPLETDGPDKVYAFPGYFGEVVFYEYPSMTDFINNTNATTHTLSTGFDGTGHVVYGGYLYYNAANTNTLVKFDISTDTEVTTATLPNAGFHNTYHYTWGGFSDIDFAVDENGLWALYATASNAGKLVVSSIDSSNLAVVKTWNTNSEPKLQMGNAFVICGVVYCMDSYNSSSNSLNYKFSTWDSTDATINITFTNPNSYTTQLDYNHNTSMLYCWSNGNCYTLGISIGGPDVTTTSQMVACNGDSTGTGSPIVSGGNPPYTFQWDTATGSQTDSTATGLVAGTYYITVTDDDGCSKIDSVTISEPAAIALSGSTTDESHLGNDGAIDLAPSGGTPPYTYNWSNSETSEDLSGLAGGTYTVTVTDSLGCMDTISFTLGSAVGTQFYGHTELSVKLFPNPASSQVTLQIGSLQGKTEITLSDALSRQVLREVVNAKGNYTRVIDVDGLSKGVYLLSIENNGKSTITKKLVIE